MRRTSPKSEPIAAASWQHVVEQAEAYLRAHQDTPVSVSRLCRIVGLSERALRNAFKQERGMSPHRFMLTDRLECVRRALRAAGTRPTTVSAIATDYGFYELGRFAGIYKQAFGESPSQTLRGNGGHPPNEGPPAKGHPHACASR
jgi:AraC family ethanolamine operon transcriptional activator